MRAISLDSGDPTPPYEQIRRQLADLIETGQLREGDKLPPVRQLAGDLRVAIGTVARAYKELEQTGYVSTGRGRGTRVQPTAPIPNADEQMATAARTLIRLGEIHGLGADEIRAILERELGASRGS